ncbi:MAG: hypothetical protein R2788_03625 [Saprospiraceae bacterium]
MKKTQTLTSSQVAPGASEGNFFSNDKDKEEPAQEEVANKMQSDKSLFKIFIF